MSASDICIFAELDVQLLHYCLFYTVKFSHSVTGIIYHVKHKSQNTRASANVVDIDLTSDTSHEYIIKQIHDYIMIELMLMIRLLTGPELKAKTYYINSNGTDADGCGHIEAPCETVGLVDTRIKRAYLSTNMPLSLVHYYYYHHHHHRHRLVIVIIVVVVVVVVVLLLLLLLLLILLLILLIIINISSLLSLSLTNVSVNMLMVNSLICLCVAILFILGIYLAISLTKYITQSLY